MSSAFRNDAIAERSRHREKGSEFRPLVGQTLGVLLFIDNEARVSSAPDGLYSVADLRGEFDLAARLPPRSRH